MVSVIVPAFNAEKYIGDALLSICRQTFQDIEIIVVNDGSTDSTLKICDRYRGADSRIKVYSTGHQGAGLARLYGVANAYGEWVMFVDADDVIHSTLIELLIHFDNGHRDIISGSVAYDGKIIYQNGLDGDVSGLEYFKALIQDKVYLGACAKLIKRSLFDNGLVKMSKNIVHNEDLLMLAQLSVHAQGICFINALCGYDYISRKGSMTTHNTISQQEWMKLYDYLKIAASEFHTDELDRLLNLFILHRLYHFVVQRASQIIRLTPDIRELIDNTKGIPLDYKSFHIVRCLQSPWLQCYEKVRFRIMDFVKLQAKRFLIRFSLLGKRWILKNIY